MRGSEGVFAAWSRACGTLCLGLSLLASLAGCTPKIGNSCTLSTDCSQLGDRLCDSTQPNGYCTIFNCDPDTCPNSVCVAFDPTLDPACGNVGQGSSPRFERSFCLAPCNTDSDCRTDYACVDLSIEANQRLRRAQVVDVYADDGGSGYSVCMALALTTDGGVIPEDAGLYADMGAGDGGVPAVCFPADAGFPTDGGVPWAPYDGGP